MSLLITDTKYLELLFEQSNFYNLQKAGVNQQNKSLPLHKKLAKEVIVVCQTDKLELTVAEDELLNNIFKAVNLTKSQIGLELINSDVELKNYTTLKSTERLVIFANSINEEYYTTVETEGKKVLYCHPINLINNDRDKKMKLWKALKKLFDR